MLSSSTSTIIFRYSLLQIPNFVSFPSSSSSFSSLHSHSTRQVDQAVDSFTRMLSMRRTPPIIQFNKILGSLSKTNHFHAAVSLFQQLQARGIAPSIVTLSIVINCCCGMGCMKLAFSVLANIFRMDYQPNTVTLTTILKGLCLCGSVEKAVRFHDRLLAHGFHFNQVTYGTFNGLCKSGHTSAAIQVLRKIPQYGIAPDVVMYSSIIDSLCKDTLVSQAFHLYSEMLANC
ncbi:hypothetical protein HN51_070703 [Arachis hypogaea]|nr:pentatricopeptide repeat-containing protein At1g12775, mitochondrial-like [Arachis hypogaea]